MEVTGRKGKDRLHMIVWACSDWPTLRRSHHQIRRTDTLNQASDGKVYKSLRPPIDYGLANFDRKERKYPRHIYKQTRAVRITERFTEY